MNTKNPVPLTGIEWAQLLCEHPELADECDWTAFDGNAWHCLLCKQPQFADRCDWSFAKEWNKPQQPGSCEPGTWYWVTLLSCQPQFADKCTVLSKFDATDRQWIGNLEGERRRTYNVTHSGWRERNGRRGKNVALLLKAKPELATASLAKDFEEEDWSVLLKTLDEVPQVVLGLCPWGKLHVGFWTGIMSSGKTKKYLEHCPWKSFGEEAWKEILYYHPEYRDQFDAHSGLKYEDLDLENWEPDIW